jgi:uncharacterized protein YoxC
MNILLEKYLIKTNTSGNTSIKDAYKKEINMLENQIELFLERFEATNHKLNKLLDDELLTYDNISIINRLNKDLSKINSYLQ